MKPEDERTLLENVETLVAECPAIRTQVAKHEKALYGNGFFGALAKIKILWWVGAGLLTLLGTVATALAVTQVPKIWS